MRETICFKPSVQTQSGRYRLTQTLRVLGRLLDNSVRAAEEVKKAAAKLTVALKRKSLVSYDDLERLRVCYHILADVLRQKWQIIRIDAKARAIQLSSPQVVEKQILREAMSARRQEAIEKDWKWIKRHHKVVAEHLIDGQKIDYEKIDPVIEVCEDRKSKAIFRYLRYTWSSPYSEYVGRRMRFLVRDRGHGGAIIGIAAIGSSIMQIAERDRWIGWMLRDNEEDEKLLLKHWKEMRRMRAERIISMMDLYVCGAVPPYSYLLGGKLVCYMMMSNEVRRMFMRKYRGRQTITRRRSANELVLLATTSLYGAHSSQYNRISYGGQRLFKSVGHTRGYGTVHLSLETFDLMRNMLARRGMEPSHEFGAGANWKIRAIRSSLQQLGLDEDLMLQHSYPKIIYVAEYAENARKFLRGENRTPRYHNRPLENLVEHWRDRWLRMRIENQDVLTQVRAFRNSSLLITSSEEPPVVNMEEPAA
jgi:Domain of unknown function (DUF4338)